MLHSMLCWEKKRKEKKGKKEKEKEKKRKEKRRVVMRSPVLNRAAQGLWGIEVVLARPIVPPIASSLQRMLCSDRRAARAC